MSRGKPTGTFWQAVAGRGAAAYSHYNYHLADLAKSLPPGELDALADKLKLKGSRLRTAAPSGENIDAPEDSSERELLRQKMAQKRAGSTITSIVGQESNVESARRTKKENEHTNQNASTAHRHKK